MFVVQPLCKGIILTLWVSLIIFVRITTTDTLTLVLLAVSGIWLWLYLGGLKIHILRSCIIKETGNIFKRKTVIMLKNISWRQIITLHRRLPAVIRLHAQGQRLLIIGLNGRQRTIIVQRLNRC